MQFFNFFIVVELFSTNFICFTRQQRQIAFMLNIAIIYIHKNIQQCKIRLEEIDLYVKTSIKERELFWLEPQTL